jgi:hypothetical protein
METRLKTILPKKDYPSELLDAASDMIIHNRYEIAVVTAQMACEICTERLFHSYFVLKNIDFLENAIDELLPS